MDFFADLHLHSHYSRAVSPEMNLHTMAAYARKKGMEILTTGDWTHPIWLREIRAQLEETKEGLYQLKMQNEKLKVEKEIYFLLSVEIASIFSQGGKSRRIHNLVFVPNIETAEKINQELLKRGCNLSSDGRPIIGLSSKNLLQMILGIDERCMLIPAHIWTPWFGLFGANSGFDSIAESFEEMSPYIYGIETGLSSDPQMNWQIKELDNRSILSFSDAHSLAKMGREATVFRLEELSYEHIRKAIMAQNKKQTLRNKNQGNTNEDIANRILYTIEFYPEEGKYHYNGHRNCHVYQTPEETRKLGEKCPVCHRRITVGVMQRVEDLATESDQAVIQPNTQGLQWFTDPKGKHPPFVKMVPLNEIIAESFSSSVSTMKVKAMFDLLCGEFGSEMKVLLKTSIMDIEKTVGEKIAEGIGKTRAGDIFIQPGYDNVYGTVKIWHEGKGKEETNETEEIKQNQLGIDF